MFRPWEETSTPSGSTGRDNCVTKSEISDKSERDIIYLDETWYDTHEVPEKVG